MGIRYNLLASVLVGAFFFVSCDGQNGKNPVVKDRDVKEPISRVPSEQSLGDRVRLGDVDIRSGILLIVDPGLGRFWRGDGDPVSPRSSDPKHVDLKVVGPDAIEAARKYDRQYDPGYLFDIPNVPVMERSFREFTEKHGLDARLEVLSDRIPHTTRAKRAVEVGGGLGVVQFNGIWGVVIGGLPADRPLPVYGYPFAGGEFNGRWRSIEISVRPSAEVADSKTVMGVMVEHGQFICSDLEAFGEFRMWESLDGLADFVFWGKDAPALAKELQAATLPDGIYGWKDIPMDKIGKYAQSVQERIDKDDLGVGVDYRPHCNLEKLNAQIRKTDLRAGIVELADQTSCGFDNRWGDGIFPVIIDRDSKGQLVRIRIDVGNEDRQRIMRRVWLRAELAVVTKRIATGTDSVNFAERFETSRQGDSGWAFSSGTEAREYMDNADNHTLLSIGTILDRFPALKPIIDSPPGSKYRLQGDKFVKDQ